MMILYFSEVMMCDENPCGKPQGMVIHRYDIAVNRTRKELDGKTIKYNRNKKY